MRAWRGMAPCAAALLARLGSCCRGGGRGRALGGLDDAGRRQQGQDVALDRGGAHLVRGRVGVRVRVRVRVGPESESESGSGSGSELGSGVEQGQEAVIDRSGTHLTLTLP